LASTRLRQAIVLIHGIGEPRPMTTLRAFVEGILGDETGLTAIVRSKPDRLSESYELRRLVVDGTRTRPATDCYEFYWAHQMEGSRVGHLWPLARLLFLRWPWRVPRPLIPLWTISWLLIAGVVWISIGVLRAGTESLRGSQPVLWVGGTILLGVVQWFASRYLADAARYLSPTPENVSIRQKIRADGVKIVRRIQNSGRYDRVVIVGHSLGSVIGYDIITHLWDQYNTRHNKPDRPRQDALKGVETTGRALTAGSNEELAGFRLQQRALWREQRDFGNPWLVTDFITVGSPLTYGAILFARDADELQRRQSDRELPTCPPQVDKGKYAYRPRGTYLVRGAPRTLRILHHAAPFAVTRWTNIYAPLRFGLFGDWIGGPLRTCFGFGILDVSVQDTGTKYLPLLAHTRYWRSTSPICLAALRAALDLNSRTWLPARSEEEANAHEADEIPGEEV
jgi:hypothetical protein